jgi:transposase-like protein
MIEGKSVRKSAQACGVHRNTAFRWRHRFLRLPEENQDTVLQGIAEADETFFLYSQKGQRDLQRRPRNRGGTAAKRGRSNEQVCVLVARDRAGATVNHVLPEFTKDTLLNVLQPVLAEDTLLCSDGLSVYKAFAADAGVAHKVVNLSAGVRIVEQAFHIQNVNAYHSRLKTWLRRFNGVATKYLSNYLGWYRWLDKSTNNATPQAWMLTALGRS